MLPLEKVERLEYILDFGWEVLLQRIVSGRTKINKEASMQLHLSAILHGLGELLCINQGEYFSIELESKYDRSNIDIVCSLGAVKAAVELKCFRKSSHRATDLDMYDAQKDISRLRSFADFQVKQFICLTDNLYYVSGSHSGHASCVSIGQGKHYTGGTEIIPTWIGRWKDKTRDNHIPVQGDLKFKWAENAGWYYLNLKL